MKNLLLLSFPYKADSKGNSFPVIPLTVRGAKGKRDFFALVDSGATISIFRSEVADELGIDVEKGIEIFLGGVGGRIRGYKHEMLVEIGGKDFVCPVVFSREYLVSLNLLGRQEFFKRFMITFEEKKEVLRLE